ncbi:unnamed protein product [Closterium sp. NIES-64]|nr:unnamed protein product [Closterium sp. NIES-64]
MPNRTSAPSRPAPPPAMRAGDRVSIVAPAGAVDARLLRQGCDVLASCNFSTGPPLSIVLPSPPPRSALPSPSFCPPLPLVLPSPPPRSALPALLELGRGLVPVVHPQVALRQAYLAGSDQARAAGLVEAFLDPSTRAVVCARGGYGCARLLPLLERALRGEGQGEGGGEAEGKGEREWECGGWECGEREAELERGAEAVLGEGGAAIEGRTDEDRGHHAKGNERVECGGTGGEGKGDQGKANEGEGEAGGWAQRVDGWAECVAEEGGSRGTVMGGGEDGGEGRAEVREGVGTASERAAGGDGGCRGADRSTGCSADVARCSTADVAQGSSRRSCLATQIRRKRFFGFSDVTALHSFFQAELAEPIISFHAPMPATSFFTDQSATASRAALRAALFEPSLTLACPPLQGRCLQRGWLANPSSCCRPNRVQGRLLGGNLSVLASLVGSKWVAGRRDTCRCCCSSGGGGAEDSDGAGGSDGLILMLEDVGEEEYRVDRMLHQLLPSLLPSLLPPAPPPCHARGCAHSHAAAAHSAAAHSAAADAAAHTATHAPWKDLGSYHHAHAPWKDLGSYHHAHAPWKDLGSYHHAHACCPGRGHGTQGHVTALSGLVLGTFSNFQGMSDEARESVRPIVEEQYGGDWDKWFWLGQVSLPHWLPVLAGLPIGHTSDNRVAPIGALVELDVETATLTAL